MTGGWEPLLRDAAAGRKRDGKSKWRRACVCCCFSLQRMLGLCFMTNLGFYGSFWVTGCVGERCNSSIYVSFLFGLQLLLFFVSWLVGWRYKTQIITWGICRRVEGVMDIVALLGCIKMASNCVIKSELTECQHFTGFDITLYCILSYYTA
jgi:hypothetical protein